MEEFITSPLERTQGGCEKLINGETWTIDFETRTIETRQCHAFGNWLISLNSLKDFSLWYFAKKFLQFASDIVR